MNPIISVVIPVYNCEKYISRCIDSVLMQKFKNFELILVDDGSLDNTSRICDEYIQKDKRIQVIHKKNGGVSSARNAGIRIARGEYITFIDSDDYIDEKMFEVAYREINRTQSDLFVSGICMEKWEEQQISQKSVYKIDKTKIYTVKELLEVWGNEYPAICMCGPWCKLYTTEILKKNQIFFDESLSYGEDTYFNLSVLNFVNKVHFSEQVFYHYCRENQESLFSKFHKDTYEIHSKVYNEQRILMRKMLCSKQAMLHFEVNYFYLLLGGVHEYYRFYDFTNYQEKLDLVKKIGADDYVKRCSVKQIPGFKNKIILFLLKRGYYKMILRIFKWHYKK